MDDPSGRQARDHPLARARAHGSTRARELQQALQPLVESGIALHADTTGNARTRGPHVYGLHGYAPARRPASLARSQACRKSATGERASPGGRSTPGAAIRRWPYQSRTQRRSSSAEDIGAGCAPSARLRTASADFRQACQGTSKRLPTGILGTTAFRRVSFPSAAALALGALLDAPVVARPQTAPVRLYECRALAGPEEYERGFGTMSRPSIDALGRAVFGGMRDDFTTDLARCCDEGQLCGWGDDFGDVPAVGADRDPLDAGADLGSSSVRLADPAAPGGDNVEGANTRSRREHGASNSMRTSGRSERSARRRSQPGSSRGETTGRHRPGAVQPTPETAADPFGDSFTGRSLGPLEQATRDFDRDRLRAGRPPEGSPMSSAVRNGGLPPCADPPEDHA